MASTSTDLIVPGDGDDKGYAVLQMATTELTELITGNLAPGETIGVRDLPRIKIPTAGLTHWAVPSIEGEEMVKEVRGIIVHVGNRRVYWEKSYEDTGGGEQPDCSSENGIIGVTNTDAGPGAAIGDSLSCATCAFNEFGDKDEKGFTEGKPCKEVRQIFLLPTDGILPMVINVTPGSLANAKEYFVGLMNVRKQRTDVETVLTLQKAQGRVEYSQVVFRKGRDLSPEAVEHVRSYAALIGPHLAGMGVERDDVDGTQVAA